jgi:hypothetical protein
MDLGKTYYTLAVRDEKLGNFFLQQNPEMDRKALVLAKREFKRALGANKFATEKQAAKALAGIPAADAQFLYVTDVTPIYGIL